MPNEVKMVVIDGVRYRPEDAPGGKSEPKVDKRDEQIVALAAEVKDLKAQLAAKASGADPGATAGGDESEATAGGDESAPAKAATPQNKARSATNK